MIEVVTIGIALVFILGDSNNATQNFSRQIICFWPPYTHPKNL